MSKNFLLSLMLCFSMQSMCADDNGTTGDCTWYFEEATGTLTISGNGTTDSYYYSSSPWNEYLTQIQKVIVEEGVTQIGYCNLVSMPNLKTVDLSSTVKTIGEEYVDTFSDCDNLETVYLHGCILSDIDLEKKIPQGANLVFENGSGYVCTIFNLDNDNFGTYENPIDKEYINANNRLVRVPIAIKNKNVAISQLQFDFETDDERFSFVENNNGKIVEMDKDRFDYDPDFGYSHTLTLTELEENRYRLVLTNSDNTSIKGDDGNVVYFIIRLNDDIKTGDYNLIHIWNVEYSTPSADRIGQGEKFAGGCVYLRDSGDFNGDDDVSVTDYAGVVKWVAGQGYDDQGVSEWVIKKASDVNEDGEVTVTDISGIVNIILYGNYKGNTSNAKARRAAKSSGAMLNIEPFSINRGETKEITVDLSSAYADLSQCQFDLNLPEGLSLASVNGRMAVYPGDLTRLADGYSHTVSSAQREDGTVRVVCLSGSNEAYNGTEGSIVRMKVMADMNVAVGTADIELTNVEFARTDASMVLGAGSIAAVTVGSETNRITSVADSSVASKEFYSADGIHKDRLTNGLNIVRHADGRIQKIMVK